MREEIISIIEARLLMPDSTADMSDSEVTALINSLELLALAFIKMIQSKEFDS